MKIKYNNQHNFLTLVFFQKEKKSAKSDTAITDKPGLLEIAAYALFFSGTLVGPQFPLSRFRDFVDGKFLDEKTHEIRESRFYYEICECNAFLIASIMASLQRFVAGVFFAVLHQWGAVWVPDAYFTSAEFMVDHIH